MSQIYKGTSGGGPVPPNVATTYVTDVNSPAVPAANILNVPGGSTITNNSDGVQTDGSSGSDTLTVQLTNRSLLSLSTAGAATSTQNIFVPTVSTGLTFVVSITAFDSSNNVMAGGELIGIARVTAGGVVSVIGTNDTFDESDAVLINADWDIVTDGTNLQISVTGVAGYNLNWSVLFTYDQVA